MQVANYINLDGYIITVLVVSDRQNLIHHGNQCSHLSSLYQHEVCADKRTYDLILQNTYNVPTVCE